MQKVIIMSVIMLPVVAPYQRRRKKLGSDGLWNIDHFWVLPYLKKNKISQKLSILFLTKSREAHQFLSSNQFW